MVVASVVLHRLNSNLIEFYHHFFFSLSLDIDFLLIRLFFEYIFFYSNMPFHDIHSNELLLLQSGCTSFYYFIITTIVSIFIGMIKISSEKNWQLKFENFVWNFIRHETNGFYLWWFRFGNDDDFKRLSCKKWSTQWEIYYTFELQIKFIRLFGITWEKIYIVHRK